MAERLPPWYDEVIAGILGFAGCAYLISVSTELLVLAGLDRSGVFTAHCIVSGLATSAVSWLARRPLIVAPNLGLCALFSFGLVLGETLPWQQGLGVFCGAAVVFLVLVWIGLGEGLLEVLPDELKKGILAGIGLLLIFSGLREAGLIVAHPVTLVTLGDLFKRSPLVATVGAGVAIALSTRGVKRSLLWGFVAALACGALLGVVPVSTAGSFVRFQISPLFNLDWTGFAERNVLIIMVPVLLVLLVESSALLAAMQVYPGEPPRLPLKPVFRGLGLGAVLGPVFGVPPLTVVPETLIVSASEPRGWRAGGVVGLLLLLMPLLGPLGDFWGKGYEIGPQAVLHPLVAPLLIVAGVRAVFAVGPFFQQPPETAWPVALGLALMPLTFSVVNGFVVMLGGYFLLQRISGRISRIGLAVWLVLILAILRYSFF